MQVRLCIFLIVNLAKIALGLQNLPLRHKIRKNVRNSNIVHEQNIISIPISSDRNQTDSQRIIDEHIMGLALEQAKEAGEKYGEVPIGAIVIQPIDDDYQGEKTRNKEELGIINRKVHIISHGRNEIETLQCASAHAEMQALRSAAQKLQNWRLLNATLYTTLEPCPMCLSAAQAFRISRIVYGAPDLRLGAIETYIKLLDYPHPFHGSDALEVTGAVRAEEASKLLVNFFRERRKMGKRKKTTTSLVEKEVAFKQESTDGKPKRNLFGRMLRFLRVILKLGRKRENDNKNPKSNQIV